MYILYY